MNEFTKNAVIVMVTLTICGAFFAMLYFAYVGLIPVETVSTIVFGAVTSVIAVVVTHLNEKQASDLKMQAVSAKYESLIASLGASNAKSE